MSNENYIYEIIIDLPNDAATIKVIDSSGMCIFNITISGINKISNVAVDIKKDVMPVIDKILDIFKNV